MNNNSQSGFSLIELLLVVVIIGIIAAIAVPSLQSGIRAADNARAISSLRLMSSVELSYYTQGGRFARLDELNASNDGNLGTPIPNGLVRGRFTFQMNPVSPTDVELRNTYTIVATKNVTGLEPPFVISVDQSGVISQILP